MRRCVQQKKEMRRSVLPRAFWELDSETPSPTLGSCSPYMDRFHSLRLSLVVPLYVPSPA